MDPIIYHLDDGKMTRGIRVGVSAVAGESTLIVDLTTGDGPAVVGKPEWFDPGYVAVWGGLVPECARMGTDPGEWEFAVMQVPTYPAPKEAK